MKEKLLTAPNMNLLKLQRYQTTDMDSQIRLGTETWESALYKGTLYDHQAPIDEFLRAYAAQYDTVEYHASFQDVPSKREMRELRVEVSDVNPDFKFCPLVPRRISHEFPLGENKFDLQEFIEAIRELGPHLGPCILRLPETLSPLQMKSLDRFYKNWPEDLALAIHFTHLDWVKKESFLNLVARDLEGTNMSILLEDRIEAPLNFGRLLSSSHLVVRFFGRPNLNQDEQRLAMWVFKLGEYRGYGIKQSHFILYEQEEMCLKILQKMANSIGGNVRVPKSFDETSNQLGFSF